jgi:hypothetical protein
MILKQCELKKEGWRKKKKKKKNQTQTQTRPHSLSLANNILLSP